VYTDPSKLCEDATNPQSNSEGYAISCNPVTGELHASDASRFPEHVHIECEEHKQSEDKQQGSLRMHQSSSWHAHVEGWDSWIEDAEDCEEASAGVGMLIMNGTLQFIRQGDDNWESSGVVCDRLPPKIVCCAFFAGFVGEAVVSVKQVLMDKIPRCFTDKANLVQGQVSSWTACGCDDD
jgi:hypothetical protein